VAEVVVHAGQEVRAGDVLARLDTFDLDRERGEIRAGLAQSEADRAMAAADLAAVREAPLPPELLFQARTLPRQREAVAMRRDVLARLESLVERQSVSVLELTRERLAVQELELAVERSAQADGLLAGEYAKAQIAAAEARLRAAAARGAALSARTVELERELDRRVVRAPADGIVVARSVRFPGEKVEIGSALFKIAHGPATRLRLYASEDRVDRMKPGMAVRFRPRSDPDRLRPYSLGRIVSVALDRELAGERVEGDGTSGSYGIDVEVERAESDLPLGAAVDAEIVLGEKAFWRALLLTGEAPAR
jgi:multidrug resistance efflux pump